MITDKSHWLYKRRSQIDYFISQMVEISKPLECVSCLLILSKIGMGLKSIKLALSDAIIEDGKGIKDEEDSRLLHIFNDINRAINEIRVKHLNNQTMH